MPGNVDKSLLDDSTLSLSLFFFRFRISSCLCSHFCSNSPIGPERKDKTEILQKRRILLIFLSLSLSLSLSTTGENHSPSNDNKKK